MPANVLTCFGVKPIQDLMGRVKKDERVRHFLTPLFYRLYFFPLFRLVLYQRCMHQQAGVPNVQTAMSSQ